MKIDVKINPLKSAEGLEVGHAVTIPVDEDYISDFDDVIGEVESEIWNIYGQNFHFNVDFTIVNEVDICEELFNRPNEGLSS